MAIPDSGVQSKSTRRLANTNQRRWCLSAKYGLYLRSGGGGHGLAKTGAAGEGGQIAIASYTSSETGTLADVLAESLQTEYGKDGLTAKYRTFKNIAELKQAGLALAVVKFGFMVDHWVTVLEVTDSEVIVGDPLNGLEKLSYDEFRKKWRFEGVVLKRKP